MVKVTRKPGPAAERLAVALKNLDGKIGKVGWFETAKYDDGTPVAYVASIHEFGYPEGGIPPRPFMRPTISEKRAEWRGIADKGARAVLRGTATSATVLEALGMKAAGDIAKTIASIQSPPLAEATVEARQRQYADRGTTGNLNKPLVDTALMVNSITSTVENG